MKNRPVSREMSLILLVGSNPLPNYLAACALRPQRAVLLYTSEVEQPMRRLKRAIQAALPDIEASSEHVADATDPRAVAEATQRALEIAPGAYLNYTGGTKVMAAHALRVFYQRGGKRERALYLDEGGCAGPPMLRFDDGNLALLARHGVSLKLSTLLELHGVKYSPRRPITPAPTPEDAAEILLQALRDPKLARRLHRHHDRF